ncbi:MAG TPA: hypothetical protein VF274_07120, partial [Alphaproteobacteria bacterium]
MRTATEGGPGTHGHEALQGPVLPALCAAACLLAIFLNFLNFNGYPIARAEVALVALVLLAIAVLVGLLCWSRRPRERMLISALFLAVVLPASLGGGAIVAVAVMLGAILLRNRALVVAGVIFAVVLLFQTAHAIVRPGPEPLPAMHSDAAALPVVVHVVLDEAIGIEGMPMDIPETVRAASWGRDLLIDNGFVVFGRAYAEDMHTVNSVPRVLGLGVPEQIERDGLSYTLGDNAYLRALKDRGYAIKVYQNTVARYCPSPLVDICQTAREYRALAEAPLPAADKAAVLLRAFGNMFDVVSFAAKVYDLSLAGAPWLQRALPPLHWEYGRYPTALGGIDALDRLIDDASRARPGEAYFAHVLLPHYPYALDAHCRVLPQSQWTSRHSHFRSREDRYRAYAAQWRCALGRVADLVRALRAARPDGDFAVIVHGDHGSRLAATDPDAANAAGLSPQDFRDSYSTLAAVRLPGLKAAYESAPVSVRALVRAIVESGFEAPMAVPEASPISVVLERP